MSFREFKANARAAAYRQGFTPHSSPGWRDLTLGEVAAMMNAERERNEAALKPFVWLAEQIHLQVWAPNKVRRRHGAYQLLYPVEAPPLTLEEAIRRAERDEQLAIEWAAATVGNPRGH